MIIEWELNAGPKVGIIVNHNAMDKGTATVAAVDKRARPRGSPQPISMAAVTAPPTERPAITYDHEWAPTNTRETPTSNASRMPAHSTSHRADGDCVGTRLVSNSGYKAAAIIA